MSTGVKIGAALIAGLLCGAAGGTVAGTKLGAKVVADSWAASDANGAGDLIAALEQLRAKKSAEGLESLEVHLNRHLVALRPEATAELGLQPATLERIAKVKQRARDYRTQHPRPESADMLEKDVAAFLGQ